MSMVPLKVLLKCCNALEKLDPGAIQTQCTLFTKPFIIITKHNLLTHSGTYPATPVPPMERLLSSGSLLTCVMVQFSRGPREG